VSTPPSAARSKPAAAAVGKVRPGVIAQAAMVGAALAIYLLVLLQAGGPRQDFDTYVGAARTFLHGDPLYAAFLHHPFPDPTLRPAYIYPPVFAILVAPFALIPAPVAAAAWTVIDQLALLGSLLIVIRWLRPSGWALTTMLCATATFYPLWIDIVQGQANLPILLLVTAGVVGIVREDPRYGVALGVAAALKVTPLLLLVWLVVDRRVKAAAWMLAAFAGMTAAGALARFPDTIVFFGQVLPALARGTAFYANQSLAAFLGRILTSNPYTDPWIAIAWVSLLVAACAAALLAWWYWPTRGDSPLVRAAAYLPLLPLLSTVTWPHHLVILLPVIWFSIIAIAGRNWPVGPTLALAGLLVLFSLLPRLPVGPAFGQTGFRASQTADPVVFLVANGLFVATLLLFVVAPWLLRSR
jgi:alpha-1,2-mannosyltransferase